MANDLQMQISADVGKALAGLSSIDTRLRQMERSVQSTNRASQDFQRNSARGFKETSEHAGNLLEQLKESGHAMRFMGGIAGEMGHKMSMLSQFTMRGGAAFGAIGLAVTAAAAGFELYNHILEDTKERTREAAEITGKYAEALQRGQEERSKGAANAGLSQADTIRKLNGVGGHQALRQAEDTARELGIPIEEARRGILKSYQFRDDKERASSVQAAKLLQLSGMGDFGSAFDELHKSHLARGFLRQGNAEAAAGEAGIHALTGRYAPGGGLGAENVLADALRNNSDNGLLAEDRYGKNVKNEVQLEQERRASTGAGRESIETEARRALDPIGYSISQCTTALLKLVATIEDPYKQQRFLRSVGTRPDPAALNPGDQKRLGTSD